MSSVCDCRVVATGPNDAVACLLAAIESSAEGLRKVNLPALVQDSDSPCAQFSGEVEAATESALEFVILMDFNLDAVPWIAEVSARHPELLFACSTGFEGNYLTRYYDLCQSGRVLKTGKVEGRHLEEPENDYPIVWEENDLSRRIDAMFIAENASPDAEPDASSDGISKTASG